MANSPTSKSASTSGAAKDDVLGADGHFTFSIDDLLANDPGGAAKVDVTKQFTFGTTAADWADQAKYLANHGIIDNHNGTYTITGDGTDFQYMVQIGNKGTWSTADVDVTAPKPHAGSAVFAENFDDYAQAQVYQDNGVDVFATVDLAAHGWTTNAISELGANGYGSIKSTSGGFWLDTMNSPGQVDISHAFTDSTVAVGGKTSVLSFDAAMQNLDYHGQNYHTDPAGSFEFRVDGVTVAKVTAADFAGHGDNNMVHFDINIGAYAAAGQNHTLTLVDTSAAPGYTGFAVDSIQIHDWII